MYDSNDPFEPMRNPEVEYGDQIAASAARPEFRAEMAEAHAAYKEVTAAGGSRASAIRAAGQARARHRAGRAAASSERQVRDDH